MTAFNPPKITAGPYPPDYEPVPTVPELVKLGLAHERARLWRDPMTGRSKSDTRFEVTAEGQQLIYDAMGRNAERMKGAR